MKKLLIVLVTCVACAFSFGAYAQRARVIVTNKSKDPIRIIWSYVGKQSNIIPPGAVYYVAISTKGDFYFYGNQFNLTLADENNGTINDYWITTPIFEKHQHNLFVTFDPSTTPVITQQMEHNR